MYPVKFAEQNIIFERPYDMNDEECKPLPAFKGPDEHGFPVVISCWELTREEVDQVIGTGKIWSVVVCTQPSPMSLQTNSPFKPKTVTTPTENFEPFNAEWVKEMMRWRKADLVQFLGKVCRELRELKEEAENVESPEVENL